MVVLTSSRRLAPRIAIGAVIVVVLVGILAVTTRGQVAPGCSTIAAGSIVESQKFTPIDQRKSGYVPPSAPINPAGAPLTLPSGATDMPSTIGGMNLEFVRGSSWYYLNRPIDATMTFAGFLAAGGIDVERNPSAPDQQFANYAQYLLGTLGDRAVPVDVGPYQGALVWADPTADGTRNHNLSWSTGTYEYTLWAVMAPDAIVNTARAVACSR